MSSFVPAPVSAVCTETRAASHEQTQLQVAAENRAATGIIALDTDIENSHAWKLTLSSKMFIGFTQHFSLAVQNIHILYYLSSGCVKPGNNTKQKEGKEKILFGCGDIPYLLCCFDFLFTWSHLLTQSAHCLSKLSTLPL